MRVLLVCLFCTYALCMQGQPSVSILRKGIDGPPFLAYCPQDVCEGWGKSGQLCKSRTCLKRAIREEELGPFWANRGKRNPVYNTDRLLIQEPRWVLVRRDGDSVNSDFDPYFVTRGKKLVKPEDEIYFKKYGKLSVRERRVYNSAEETPFFAARGKKPEDLPE